MRSECKRAFPPLRPPGGLVQSIEGLRYWNGQQFLQVSLGARFIVRITGNDVRRFGGG